MSEAKGKLVTCDRCGATVFLAKIGAVDRDGGFTRYDTFEDEPEGWQYASDISCKLCPECNKEYRELIRKFKEQKNE